MVLSRVGPEFSRMDAVDKYEVIVDRRVQKSVRRIPPKHFRQIKTCLERLSDSPRPHNCKKLQVQEGYRVAVGEYRVLYTIDDKARIVKVYKIVKRNDYSYRD